MQGSDPSNTEISFSKLIKQYAHVQSNVTDAIKKMSSGEMSKLNPATFLLLQMKMAKVTQVGESISNLISQVNSLVNAAVRNQKTQ